MDSAAAKGHLQIIQWLNLNRSEGCTVRAMDNTAYSRSLEMVKWLHVNRTEDCTTNALIYAIEVGDFAIALFLHANRSEDCTEVINNSKKFVRNLEMVEWACEHYREKVLVHRLLRRPNLFDMYLVGVLRYAGLLPTTTP